MNLRLIRFLILSFLAGVGLLITWFYWPKAPTPAPQAPILRSSVPATPSPTPVGITSAPSPVYALGGPPRNPHRSAQEVHDAEVKREQSIIDALIQTPITFYGKVVDEKGDPVPDAKIVMLPADNPYGTDPQYERASGTNGLFSISDIHGVALTVIVSKEGYYSGSESQATFGYGDRSGDEKPPHADQNDPAVFVLRKMSKSESLIVQHRNIKVDRAGTPASMDLRTGETSGAHSADIQVEAWTHDQAIAPGTYKHYDWKCLITVPGGGLQVRAGDQFNFEAPADDYQTSDEIAVSSTAAPWTSQVTREYFLKLANGEYARMNFTMHASGNHFFTVTSYLNPTPGHRNLEYDPSQGLQR